MANCVRSLIWLLILIFVSFFVASFCSSFYIILLPLTVCFGDLKPVTNFLLQGLQFPHYCATRVKSGGSSQTGYLHI
ncbi:hypothetical protein ABEB36_009960 [Hypothenemus hampei]|uniref:Uncharacterized protein n=1 Tax=Hypothenemus hampei TaxID=57062 RepID=A0ABD1EK62_HYPHA